MSGTFNTTGTSIVTGASNPMCDAFDEIQPSEGRTEPADDMGTTVSVEAQTRLWYQIGQK
jgi:hypothetical protein